MKKIILLIIGFFIGVSIISVSVVSYTLCDSERISNFLINESGILIDNETIFLKDYNRDFRMEIYICSGDQSKNNVYFISTHFLKEGCKYFLKNRGEEYKDILSNKTIKVNDNELIVREKGLFCLNKRIGSKK
ncbi:MAG: hypothetical protein QT05_C0049G0005 [archaeon GW2011_AR13]|nr:MAG: hypothetical protein QT05_C0049G0005 [archaeon GW2011_AR13]HIG94298.1 hypothetical protein [Nanoarchaeota archaeon]HIH63067.1 hypothetical protein [Nanoarchaeota archaeon]HIJ09506.1 hypothetical protein [Nanoarchaeota archaeon]